MALTSKKFERIYSKTGSDADKISTSAFDEMKEDFDNNHYLNDVGQLKVLGPVLYQMQLMQNDIDELRRYIVSAELLLPDTMGDSLPTSDPASSGQLWNNRGVLTISRG